MTITINTYFEQAQLALAAYALNLAPGIDGALFRKSLTDAGMTTLQAERFADRYEIIDSQQNTSSGFAATLFRERVTPETLAAGTAGQYRLAVRGTEFDIDKVNDLIIADAGGILLNGVARAQVTDMYSYYTRLLGLGKLNASTPLTVAGHSLGGHLAAAFTRLFPVATAYAFNGAGFYDNAFVNGVFDQLAGHPTTFDPARIKNIYGDTGPEVVPNTWWHTQYGERIPVFIENQLQVPNPEAPANHSMKILSDALVLYNLLAKLDPNLDMNQIDAMFKAASNRMDNSLEKGLQRLVKLFQNQDLTLTTRDAYYAALIGLRDSFGTAPLPAHSYVVVPLTTVDASVALKETPSGLAYRYALEQLNPFAIVTNTNLYGAHNTDHHLDLYDKNTGEGAMTEQYLKDRAAFLTEVIKANVTDKEFFAGGIRIPGDADYQDATTTYKFVGGDIFVLENKQILFGGNGSEALNGGSKADHLYGGGGVDIIHGGDGDDYLQGDAGNDELFGDKNDDLLLGMDGNDKLDGGEGMDSLQGGRGDDDLKGGDGAYFDLLYGGEGDDTLIGGKGDDFLSGDEGNDTYQYTTGDGRDTIKDIDGLGSIIIDNQPALNGGKKLGDGVYRSDDKQFTYVFAGNLTLGGALVINDDVIVEDFKNGYLGITLGVVDMLERPWILASGIGIAKRQNPCAFHGSASFNSDSYRAA